MTGSSTISDRAISGTALRVSLTSIPPRFNGLGRTLRSLLDQSIPVCVQLTLPRSYDRFPGAVTAPSLPEGVTLHWTDTDAGPATKWLPAIARSSAPVLMCDDDWIYAPDWAARFVEASKAHPSAAIAASTFDGSRIGAPGATILQGFAGALIRRDLFGDLPYQPPAEFAAVDDIWLSGALAAAATPITTIDRACSPSGNEAAALQSDPERNRLNRACVAHFQNHFAIWRGAR